MAATGLPTSGSRTWSVPSALTVASRALSGAIAAAVTRAPLSASVVRMDPVLVSQIRTDDSCTVASHVPSGAIATAVGVAAATLMKVEISSPVAVSHRSVHARCRKWRRARCRPGRWRQRRSYLASLLSRTVRRLPVAASQIRTRPALVCGGEPGAVRGDRDRGHFARPDFGMVRGFPVAVSQIPTCPCSEPANKPGAVRGDRDRVYPAELAGEHNAGNAQRSGGEGTLLSRAGSSSPVRVRCSPVATSQIRTRPPWSPVASQVPSGAKVTAVAASFSSGAPGCRTGRGVPGPHKSSRVSGGEPGAVRGDRRRGHLRGIAGRVARWRPVAVSRVCTSPSAFAVASQVPFGATTSGWQSVTWRRTDASS